MAATSATHGNDQNRLAGFLAGVASGGAKLAVGHPFDTYGI